MTFDTGQWLIAESQYDRHISCNHFNHMLHTIMCTRYKLILWGRNAVLGQQAKGVVTHPPCLLPKLAWTFVFCQFSSSRRHAASDAIVSSAGTRSSSSSARRATSSAKSRSEMTADQMTLHSCLCQQIFLTTSPHPWQKTLALSRHSVYPAHLSGTRQVRVRRRRPICLEQSPWRRPERANTWQI